MPTVARKFINKALLDLSSQVEGKVLFVGVNYQWDKQYREIFKDLFTIDKTSKTKVPADLVADIESCPELENDSFDAVVMVGIWEILESEISALGEIYRILKKGGKLLFGFPGEHFYLPVKRYSISEVTLLIEIFLLLEKLEVLYYKTERPHYIVGVARK